MYFDTSQPGALMMKTKAIIAVLPGFLLLASCATPMGGQMPANAVQCTDPRPQICTMDYTPVCATRAEATEMATYANACTACADLSVIYHQPGACGS
jgi:hypothetical protein